jgi:L-lactate dehydrogenase complex protein LldG
VDLGAITDPHQLHDVDFAVLPGELGVAESGAVWVLEARVHPRAVAFLAQHIAVVLPASAIVHNLHQAYDRVAIGAAGFSMWLSGPSKTADIEQALVIGAHGARSCTAIVVG